MNEEIIKENLFPADIKYKNGNINMDPQERDKYLDIISDCSIIKGNGVLVTMKLTKDDHDNIVIFNGSVAYNNQYGGFSIKGFIDLNRNYLGLSYDLKNDNNYQYIGYKLDNLEIKGKVI